jgi:glycosyltransferase involved in cell wall biosynthesis
MPSRRRFIEKLQSSYTICITKGIQEHFNLTNNRNSRVVYNGLLTSCKKENDNREKTFLFVGRLAKEKNPFGVIRAFNTFYKTNQEYKLLLAGSAVSQDEYNKLLSYCEENNLKDNVCFLGARNDIGLLMLNASAVIVASEFEGFGRVTTEAMLNGCLVIGRNTTGTKEQFDNGLSLTGEEIGIRFDGDEDLCEKMLVATSLTKEKYNKYTKRAKTVVELLYTPQKCADDIYNFFKCIIEQQ